MAFTNSLITIKAVLIAALMVLIIVFKSCKSSTITYNQKEVKLIFSYPLIQINDGKINFSNLLDTISIFYYKTYILYRLPPTKRFETDENIPGTEPYFLYKKNYTYGFLFQSKNDSIGNKLLIDSFLFKRGMRTKDFEIPPDTSWKLLGTVKNASTVLDKYAPIKQGNEMSLDSIFYCYTPNMKNVEYSFSRKLDSLKHMKLFRIRFLIKEKYSPTYKLTLPKREFLFEIKEVAVDNPKEILDLFEKFKYRYK